MHHDFLGGISSRLAERKIATLRYQFPYMQVGRKRPDHARILQATARAAIAVAKKRFRLPIVAGGKSMGGRMTSLLLADNPDPDVVGLAFLGFPLYPAGRPSIERAEHLRQIKCPMLFVHGTRDALGDVDRMRALSRSLGRRSKLHVVRAADHGFDVLVRSGRSREAVRDEIADAVAKWGRRFGP